MTDDFLNDEALDRLVDGEMSPDERRQFIASLETRPDGWRRCALAFLESQFWRGDMRRLVIDATRSEPAVKTAAPVTTRAAGADGRRGSRLGSALAIAASVLLAFGLGSQLRWSSEGGDDGPSLAVAPPAAPQAVRPAPNGDAVTLVLNDLEGAEHRVQVPLVEGQRLGEDFADAPQWSTSPELQRRLGEQGWGIKARRRYAPLYFEQQNQVVPMVVPVDDAVVAPVKRKVL